MGRRPFIDKKNARTFRLVNRSVMQDQAELDEQGNPLPDRVFAEVTPGAHLDSDGPSDGEGADTDDYEEGAEDDVDVGSEGPSMYRPRASRHPLTNGRAETRAGEAAKFGIFYDDRNYDYTQHLKPIGRTPGAVFMAAPASTIEHSATALAAGESAETLINHATYGTMRETAADENVVEVLDALDDAAYIDEDAFEDDFIVQLDREEARVLAPLHRGTGARGKGLDTDFEQFLQVYDNDDEDDGSAYGGERRYDYPVDDSDEEPSQIDVVEVKPFGKGGPSRMHEVDEVRRELRDGDQRLLDHILYTTDDEGGEGPEALDYVTIEVENSRALNCQTACKFLATAKPALNRPQIIREGGAVEPVRISRKTGLPMSSSSSDPAAPAAAPEDEAPENKGRARPKTETAEEKKARKAAVRTERSERRAHKKTVAT